MHIRMQAPSVVTTAVCFYKPPMAKLPTPALPGSGFKATRGCNSPQSQPRMPSAPLFLRPKAMISYPCGFVKNFQIYSAKSS